MSMTPDQMLQAAFRVRKQVNMSSPWAQTVLGWVDTRSEVERWYLLFCYGTPQERYRAAAALSWHFKETLEPFGLSPSRCRRAWVARTVRDTMTATGLTLYKSWRLKTVMTDSLRPMKVRLMADLLEEFKQNYGQQYA
jgi:hypothetical protein